MRLQEFADAEEQIKLWKLISDSVWNSIKLIRFDLLANVTITYPFSDPFRNLLLCFALFHCDPMRS